jgi:hypothetical protein
MKKIFISNPIIKYNINNVLITIFVFNKEKSYILNKIQKLNKMFIGKNNYNLIKDNSINSLFKFIKDRSLSKIYKVNKLLINEQFINGLFHFSNHILKLNSVNSNSNIISSIKKLIKGKTKKIFIYKYYLSILYFNNYKFNINSILNINNILSKIYGKKVSLNIIDLKYLYLDNNIFVDVVSKKLGDRRNSILKVVRKATRLTKEFSIHPLLLIK